MAGGRIALLAGIGLTMAGCIFSTPPFADLAGTWQTGANPTGQGWVLALRTRADSVMGYGFRLGLEGHVRDSVAVAGRAQGASVHLRLAQPAGDTAIFEGEIASSTRLAGTLAIGGRPLGRLQLFRE